MKDSHKEGKYIDNQQLIATQLPLGFHQACLSSQTQSHAEANL